MSRGNETLHKQTLKQEHEYIYSCYIREIYSLKLDIQN